MYSEYKNSKRTNFSIKKEGINLETKVAIVNDLKKDLIYIKAAAEVATPFPPLNFKNKV